jgi:hypothetical protein
VSVPTDCYADHEGKKKAPRFLALKKQRHTQFRPLVELSADALSHNRQASLR